MCALQGTLSQQGTPGGTQASSQAASAANPFSNLFQALGISLLGGSGSASPMGTPRGGTAVGGVHTANGHLVMMVPGHSSANGDSVGGGHGEPVAVPLRMAPGAALVVWAETEGRHVLEQVVAGCQGLDGDAVVVFLRALCAVSREELELDRPRIFSLERLVEAANLNLGELGLCPCLGQPASPGSVSVGLTFGAGVWDEVGACWVGKLLLVWMVVWNLWYLRGHDWGVADTARTCVAHSPRPTSVHCPLWHAGRIRLVWGKLWAVISAHLVASTCHTLQVGQSGVCL